MLRLLVILLFYIKVFAGNTIFKYKILDNVKASFVVIFLTSIAHDTISTAAQVLCDLSLTYDLDVMEIGAGKLVYQFSLILFSKTLATDKM